MSIYNLPSSRRAVPAFKRPKPMQRELIRVASYLPDEPSLAEARKMVLRCVQGVPPFNALPSQAKDFSTFQRIAPGSYIAAVRKRHDEDDIWALRVDQPDLHVPGHHFMTEVVVGGRPDERPWTNIRLHEYILPLTSDDSGLSSFPGLCLQASNILAPEIVSTLIHSPGLKDSKRQLSDAPTVIHSEMAAQELCSYLCDPDRRLPAYVFASLDDLGQDIAVSATRVAKYTAGMASVYIVPAHFTWCLSKELGGKGNSVFNGAIRTYLPGFSREIKEEEIINHRFMMRERLTTEEEKQRFENVLCDLPHRFIANPGGYNSSIKSLTFASVRFADIEIADKVRIGDTVSALLSELEVKEGMERQIKELEEDVRDWREIAEDLETQIAENEREEVQLRQEQSEELPYYEHEGARVGSDIVSDHDYQPGSGERLPENWNDLQALLNAKPCQVALPASWGEVKSWIEQYLSERLEFTTRAKKEMKNGKYKDTKFAVKCLLWLAYVILEERRTPSGGGRLKNMKYDAIGDSGQNKIAENAIVGKNQKYNVGNGNMVDWHIKQGSKRDPQVTLRIYYYYDEERRIIVVDHLPEHRKVD